MRVLVAGGARLPGPVRLPLMMGFKEPEALSQGVRDSLTLGDLRIPFRHPGMLRRHPCGADRDPAECGRTFGDHVHALRSLAEK